MCSGRILLLAYTVKQMCVETQPIITILYDNNNMPIFLQCLVDCTAKEYDMVSTFFLELNTQIL